MGNDKITIGERIEDLLKQNNMTSKELSDKVTAAGFKLSTATLSDIINNVDKGYSYKIFVEIAKQLNVSTDYLFGSTELFTTDNKLKFVCEYTGLSEDTIKCLAKYPYLATDFIDNMILRFVNSSIFQILDYEHYKKKLINASLTNAYKECVTNANDDDPLFVYSDGENILNVVKEYQLRKYLIYSAFNDFLNNNKAEKICDEWNEHWLI